MVAVRKLGRYAFGAVLAAGLAVIVVSLLTHDAVKAYAAYQAWKLLDGDAGSGARVSVDGIDLYYEVHGEGEPVVLLHTGTAAAEAYMHQIPELAARYQVIAPDARGHGRSADGDAPFDYAVFASDVVAILDDLELERAHVVGHGDGAVVALTLAMQHPARVRSLLLLAARYRSDAITPDMREFIETSTARTWLPAAASLYRRIAQDPERWPVVVDKVKALVLSQPSHATDDLAAIGAPTLVVVGEADRYVSEQHTRQLVESVPQAELRTIEHGGHMLPIERPDLVTSVALEFLSRN